MKYDLKQRVFIVKKYYELRVISLVQRAFNKEYPKEDTPTHPTIKNILCNFEKYGSVAHVSPKKKIQVKNERLPKMTSKSLYRISLICQ